MPELRLRSSILLLPLHALLAWTGAISVVRLPSCSHYTLRILYNVHFVIRSLWFSMSIKHSSHDIIPGRFHPPILTTYFLTPLAQCSCCSDFPQNFSTYSSSPRNRKFKLTHRPHVHNTKTKLTSVRFLFWRVTKIFVYKIHCTFTVEISNETQIVIPSMKGILNNGSSDTNRPSSSKWDIESKARGIQRDPVKKIVPRVHMTIVSNCVTTELTF